MNRPQFASVSEEERTKKLAALDACILEIKIRFGNAFGPAWPDGPSVTSPYVDNTGFQPERVGVNHPAYAENSRFLMSRGKR